MRVLVFLCIIFLTTTSSAQYIENANSKGIDHVFYDIGGMGGGAVFFDYDNDGWEDVYITGGVDPSIPNIFREDSFYKNKGDGTFEKILGIGFEITRLYNTVAAVSGDVNNDGYRDLFVTTWRGDTNLGEYARNLLFMNNGDGTFTESSEASNLVEKSFSMGASMLDYNHDGFLDIYVINYQKSNSAILDGDGEIIGFDHECFENFFYENNGDGTFTEKAAPLGINNNGCGLAVMPTDYDQDNDQDIYVANDFGEFIVPNSLYQNSYPTESFANVSTDTEADVGVYAMGISYADIDKDSDFDYYISNLGRNVMLLHRESGVFSDISTGAGVENTYTLDAEGGLLTTSWGTAFLDVNNDTWPDLFVANGRIPAAPFIATGETDPNMLYINNGDLTFEGEVLAGDNLNKGRGMAYCDFDKDGDLDIMVVVQHGSTSADPKTVFFENQLNPTGSDNKNWAQFDLEGVSINKDAMGAKVILTVNGEELIQEVHGQGSHASQHSLILHFGLGDNTNIDKAEIIWSAGSKQEFTNLDANRRYELKEGGVLSIDTPNKVKNDAISIYPNPVKDKVYIRNLKQDSKITIYTLDGKTIQKGIVKSNSPEFNIDNLSKGVYLLQIRTNDSNFNQLLIKE